MRERTVLQGISVSILIKSLLALLNDLPNYQIA